MKPRRRPHPNTPAKIQENRRRARRVATARAALRTGPGVARIGRAAEPRARKPARQNLRSQATSAARANRTPARSGRRRLIEGALDGPPRDSTQKLHRRSRRSNRHS